MQRLFVAVELGHELRAGLKRTIEHLRPQAPSAKWVHPESIHLTLVFLGYWPEDKLTPLRQTLTDVARRHTAHSLRVQGGGGFGSGKHPRVLWVGIVGAREQLCALQGELAQALVPLGHQPEKQAFHPHLTLARAREAHGDAQLGRCVPELEKLDLGTLPVRALTLFRSQLSPQGARYTELASAALAPSSVADGRPTRPPG